MGTMPIMYEQTTWKDRQRMVTLEYSPLWLRMVINHEQVRWSMEGIRKVGCPGRLCQGCIPGSSFTSHVLLDKLFILVFLPFKSLIRATLLVTVERIKSLEQCPAHKSAFINVKYNGSKKGSFWGTQGNQGKIHKLWKQRLFIANLYGIAKKATVGLIYNLSLRKIFGRPSRWKCFMLLSENTHVCTYTHTRHHLEIRDLV